MKRLVALAALTLLAACGGGNASNGLSIGTAFSPDPPKQGTETVTVRLQDPSGAPVKGADVRIVTTMPQMSMSGPTAVATDNGDGSYSAKIVVAYATKWVFAISAKSDEKTATATIDRFAK